MKEPPPDRTVSDELDTNAQAGRDAAWREFLYIVQIALWLLVIAGCLIAAFGG